MRAKLERLEVVYDQKNDKICIAAQAVDGGFVLKPSTENAVHAVAAWAATLYCYEPKLYRAITWVWRTIKLHIFRRPVCIGSYKREIPYDFGGLEISVRYFGKPKDKIPFLRRNDRV